MSSGASHRSVRARLRSLVEKAGDQDADTARAALLHRAVDLLVPDEALLLLTLARQPVGRAVPLVHIHSLTGTGLTGEPLLENATTLGREAELALPHLTPAYVTRLLTDGLAEIGPPDDRLEEEYQSVLAAPEVLAVLTRARRDGVTPRVLRHTLVLSSLGFELCAGVEPA
ncbi:MAG TPA: hypothetical protein VFG72_04955 [Marmoricola sp.]|nr:hypothetical protein [Marmoricola sp.]